MAKQNLRLYEYLKTHDGVTTLEAFTYLGICRLSERIRELEDDRYIIDRQWETTQGGARVVRYRLLRDEPAFAYG